MKRTEYQREQDAALLRLARRLGDSSPKLAPVTARRCRICGYDRIHKGMCSFCGA